MRDHLLGAKRDARRALGWERERLVEAVRVERLRAAGDGGEALERDADDVHLGLLGLEGDAARLRVEADHLRALLRGAEPLAHQLRPHPARRAELRDLLEDVVVAVEEEGEAAGEVVDLEAAVERRLGVGDRVREGEAHLLDGRAALLADVVAGDRDRVPLRDSLGAVLEDVRGQAHRRLGREDEVAARDVLLQDVVLDRAAELLGIDALLLADEFVEEKEDRGGRVDRHRGRDLVERDLVEADPHVLDRVDGDAGPPDLALAERVVGVAAELGRQVERHREAGRAVLEEVAVTPVRVLGAREAGVLAHRPKAVAVHAVVDPACERVLARLAEPLLQPFGDVARVIKLVDLDARVGEDALVVRPRDRRDVAVLARVDFDRLRVRLGLGLSIGHGPERIWPSP